MRILIYTQFCAPEPVPKIISFARELVRRGHEVRVLTGLPNYPTGRLYPGYRVALWQREIIDGVPIYRVPLFPNHSPSALGRGVNYLSFAAASALPLLCGFRPDVVYVHNLVTYGALAVLNSWLRKVPFVLDVQDIWPDSVINSGMTKGWVGTPISFLCNFVYRNAARIVTQSEGFRDLLVSRGVRREKIEVVYNWYDEPPLNSERDSVSRATLGFDGWFNILYAGNIGIMQKLGAVAEAAQLLSAAKARIRFVIMGHGVALQELKDKARQIAPEHILILPPCSAARALAVQQQADALLVHLQKIDLFKITIPSKVQSYLASGKPILAGLQGEAARLLEISGSALIAQPEDPRDIADCALKLAKLSPEALAQMGRAGRAFFERELTVAKGVDHFERIFGEILSSPTKDPGFRSIPSKLAGSTATGRME